MKIYTRFNLANVSPATTARKSPYKTLSHMGQSFVHSRFRTSVTPGFTLIELLVVIAIISLLAALLPERPEQPADHLALLVERDETLLQGPGEAEIVVDFQQLGAREPRRDGGGLPGRGGRGWWSGARRHHVNCSGRETWRAGPAKSSATEAVWRTSSCG